MKRTYDRSIAVCGGLVSPFGNAPGSNGHPVHAMSELADKSWLRRRTEKAFSKALMRAYKTVRVEPQRFLTELRAAYGLPVSSLDRKSTRLNSSHVSISY